MDEKTLNETFKAFKGKGGGPETESQISDSKLEKDVVSVWANNKDIAAIIKRCKSSVVAINPLGDGVELIIERKAFRGIPYAFKSLDK